MSLPKQILVPIDFSPTSACALEYAKTLVEELPASLHVLHVVEAPHILNAETTRAFRDELAAAAEGKLEVLLPETEIERLQATVEIKCGSPFVEIVEYAQHHEIDLIVMGTHGRGPWAHALLGGVADKVVRKAPCPVLTMRAEEASSETT